MKLVQSGINDYEDWRLIVEDKLQGDKAWKMVSETSLISR